MKSSQIASRAVTANVVDSIMRNYARQKMFDAMRNLKDVYNKETNSEEGVKYPPEKIIENRKKLHIYFDKKTLKKDEYDTVDNYRRLVSHHFQRIFYLYETGAIDEDLMRSLSPRNQTEFYLKIIEPLEGGKNPNYKKESFKKFKELYDLEEEFPEITDNE